MTNQANTQQIITLDIGDRIVNPKGSVFEVVDIHLSFVCGEAEPFVTVRSEDTGEQDRVEAKNFGKARKII